MWAENRRDRQISSPISDPQGKTRAVVFTPFSGYRVLREDVVIKLRNPARVLAPGEPRAVTRRRRLACIPEVRPIVALAQARHDRRGPGRDVADGAVRRRVAADLAEHSEVTRDHRGSRGECLD